MAENVGSIYYTVEADTSSLVNGANAADRSLDSMQGSMQRTDATAGKLQTRMTRWLGLCGRPTSRSAPKPRHTAG